MTPRPVPAPVSDTSAAREAIITALCQAPVFPGFTRIVGGILADAVLAVIEPTEADADVRAELIRWRAVDRIYPPDTAEWWQATLRLRDIADRAESETRA